MWVGGETEQRQTALPTHALPRADPQGSLVRAVRRLEELLRQLAEGLGGIGESALAERFEAARERVKRDIIFAASLYL
jgi:superfamily II RNA helicase